MSGFKSGIQVKPGYFGDQKIKRILEILGANQCIANNPRVIEAVSTILEEISRINEQDGTSHGEEKNNVTYVDEVITQKLEAQLEGMFPEYALAKKEIPKGERKNTLKYFGYLSPYKQVCGEELGGIKTVLEKCLPLSDEDFEKWIGLKRPPEGSQIYKYGVYYGIEVDQKGNVSIQELTAFRSGGHTKQRTTFSINEHGELVESFSQIKSSGEYKQEEKVISVSSAVPESEMYL